MNHLKLFTVVSFLLFTIGCNDTKSEQQMLKQAVAIESSDECHLCGMLISNFAGPKGEIAEKRSEQVNKFCSTRDMFAYYLQPENKRNVTQLFVHDMSKMPWDELNDGHFIDAKSAWFVTGSSKKGAMGLTLASFGQKEHADAFKKEFGGQVYSFGEITIDRL
ncbi:nitrous oxide reductase accessory protein NosL [Psychromonas sp. Urea-02u-13]|uniref:nitrous oxide reductase accessory protein NosL n=1 Tax=Psychromonas sp. Urea-02u-13 TaxID=2058326 RepID=UPI000C32F87A|nr:nitrous oxide reductase accessory protein NosL [Psychromonas sp. Urea-02u-13]PKG40814.1 nitrous oxide reductase accessory protein NosL [Psychromonas sp. Urea-02u-13]